MSRMNFEVLKQSIIDNVLAPAEAGRWLTIGHQRQSDSAEVINTLRQVVVYFSESQFPRSAGGSIHEVMHDIAFKVELSVASPAQVDLSVLNDEAASASEKATAMRAISEAGIVADSEMDELLRLVFQTLMDARNYELGMAPGDVSNRWVDQMQKDTPGADGEYMMLTASMRLSCRVAEQITGEDLVNQGNKTFDSDFEFDGDDIQKSGVKVTP